MKTRNSAAARRDHGFRALLHSNFLTTGCFNGWSRAMASWLRLLELVAEQAGYQVMNRWSAQA